MNITKRVTRHVKGKSHSYFAVYPPGFEGVCAEEMKLVESAESVSVEKGGASFSGKIPVLYRANLCLRGAVRVLMRVESFKAENFRELYRRSCDIPWELYLTAGADVKFSVSCRNSRLFHSGAIEENILDAIKKAPLSPGEACSQTVFVRFEDNVCTISLDSSGEPLYRRGFKKHVCDAPLRENICAMLLEYAGANSFEIFLDPMCGSGTFALEALSGAGRLPLFSPQRAFSFEAWPVFSPETFRHEARRSCQARGTLRIFSGDIDISAAKMNFDEAAISPNALEGIDLSRADFFTLDRGSFGEGRMLVAFNPPYGKRIGASGDFFTRIGEKILADFASDAAVIVLPSPFEADLGKSFYRAFSFSNGGIPVSVMTRNIHPYGMKINS